jgi:MFS family permease
VGYDVSDNELAELAKEVEAESVRDNMTYLLDMFTAILASEKSPAILTKLLDLWGNILDSLAGQGKWTVLDSVLGLLHVTAEVRPDLGDDHKKQLANLLNNLGRPERMKMIETYLNQIPNAITEGLPAVLLSMSSAAIPALCTLLANLEAPAHHAIVAEALETLAKDQPDHVLHGLSDRRPRYVKNLLAIELLHATPGEIAAMNAAAIAPGILLGLFAAHAIDRVRRRPVLIGADLVRAGLLLALPLAAFSDVLAMAHVVAFAFCRGLFDFVFGVAEQSYLPVLVPPRALVRANGRLQAGDSSAEAVGFAAGGWLVQLLSAPLALLIDSASYLASAFLLARIRTVEPPPASTGRLGGRARWREITAGAREIAPNRELRAITAAAVLVSAAQQAIGTVYMLFVYRELGFAAGPLGMLFALGAVSSLAAAFAAERVPERLAGLPVMVGGLAVCALGPFILALAPGATLFGVAAIAAQQIVGDGGYVLYEIHQRSLRQRITPANVLGRVSGAIRFAASLAMLGGAALGGWLGGAIGLRATLVAGGCGTALAALAALRVGRASR